ncbi:MAG: rhomboid family intramembrane serine protease [Chlamydiota bacterium]|jgi:GlpG protein
MRIVGEIVNQDFARRFSYFLKKQGIENKVESESHDSQDVYSIWVFDEDQVEEAKQFLAEFQKDPHNEKYEAPKTQNKKLHLIEDVPLARPAKKKKSEYFLTLFFIGICFLIYGLNLSQELSLSQKEGKHMAVLITPIQLLLFYDVTQPVLEIKNAVEEYPVEALTVGEVPADLAKRLKEIDEMPQFRGVYEILLNKVKNQKKLSSGPMFVKIREGQIWRLFSPCILHTSLLHIIFNMLWLWVLGKQVEERVKRWKIVLFILCVGIISNTAQYLVSGPLFLGFSGVVVGMAGFIYARQKYAPWEGYPLQRSTLLFLGIFLVAMLGLQVVSFFIQTFMEDLFIFNIANTAHIIGGVVGILLGRSSFFAMEAK